MSRKVILQLMFFLIVPVFSMSMLTGCSGLSNTTNNDALVMLPESEEPKELSKEEKLALSFDAANKSWIDDVLYQEWSKDPTNVEINAMLRYARALNTNEKYARQHIAYVNPNYDGVMSEEILTYGMNYFDSKEEWLTEHNKVYTKELQEYYEKLSEKVNNAGYYDNNYTTKYNHDDIKKWIEDRYTYYDKLNGKYAADKYTDVIFKEANDKFGLTINELKKIYWGEY